MYKQFIVLSSLLVGAGSAGMAMYLQANPLALSKGQRVNLETYLYSAQTDRRASESVSRPVVGIVEDAPPMIVDLPEVTVGPERPAVVIPSVAPAKAATGPELQAPAAPTQPGDAVQPGTAPRELHPCSKFREIGPMNVDEGVPHGARGVRDLC